MQKKNLIRFLESLILLPVITMSMPSFGSTGIALPVSAQNVVSSQVALTKPNSRDPAVSIPTNPEIEAELQERLKAELQEKLLEAQAEKIDAYFRARGMPLHGSGKVMALEALKNNLDYRLLPAIAVIESTGGKFACRKATHSFFGWGSCRINFESRDKAIEIVARNLGGNNPNTASYYKGKTTVQILQKYNPPSIVPLYATKVINVMNIIGVKEIIVEIEKDIDGKEVVVNS